ncbi:22993_t:CDS:2, partial [Racocetra persica]
IEEDTNDETDVEDEIVEEYDTIMSSSSLLNFNYLNLYGIILEPSYNLRSFMITKTGIITLITFFYQVLTYLDIFQFQTFPKSQHYVKKLIAQPNSVLKYTVCLHCYSLYLPTDLPLKTSGHTKCLKCEKVLTKAVRRSGGKLKYKVKIASILANESNKKLIDSPFKRQVEKGVLGDIYNRNIWKEFLDERGQPFFVGGSTNIRIGLAFNLDYENLILVGIIPGPKEPDTNQLQNYLQSIVNVLKQLWSSQLFKTSQYLIGRMFHCALIQIACDIPAARKVTGLAPHSSKH